jgi:hypothetical protein
MGKAPISSYRCVYLVTLIASVRRRRSQPKGTAYLPTSDIQATVPDDPDDPVVPLTRPGGSSQLRSFPVRVHCFLGVNMVMITSRQLHPAFSRA